MIPVCAECGREHLPNCREQRHQEAVKSSFSFYYPLFSHMASNHDLILLDSEMEDILQVCREIDSRKKPTKGKLMIDRVMAFKSSDGQLFDNLEKLQRHELGHLLLGLVPKSTAGSVGVNLSSEVPIDEAVSLLVKSKAQVVDVLTMSPNAKPKARAINGGTKTRPSRAGTIRMARPVTPATDNTTPQPA